MFGSNGLMRSGGMVADGLRAELARVRAELATLKAEVVALAGTAAPTSSAALRAVASTKIDQGANLTRAEAAAFLGVNYKKVQRLDGNGKGTLPRCPGFGAVVRYAARDVLRFASARRKER